ncbi:MAG TPA: hypothetical protein VMW17_17045 [Candidatus Binatia bacterium]|nr:hypothetical protein [Candidatus Binatia bacterium]
MRITTIRDARGRPCGRLVATQNITERKRAEELRHDLIHTMVHDLRGPLTSIFASLQMMREAGASGSNPIPPAVRCFASRFRAS